MSVPAKTKAPAKRAAKAPAMRSKPVTKRQARPESIVFRGQRLELVPREQLPASLLFDITDLRNGGGLMSLMAVLRSLLGQDGFHAVRDAVTAEDDPTDVVTGLLNGVFAAYDITDEEEV